MRHLLFALFFTPFAAQAQPNYTAYGNLLGKYVSNEGKVNYKGLKADTALLSQVVREFAAQTPAASWPKNERLAFWINAYNFYTLKLIADNYPVKSIMELDKGKTWDVKRIQIGGAVYSLNQIEHEIIRPQFKDARIHFAVNCAAKSCPPLLNKPYLPTTVRKQLEQRTRAFVQSKHNEITAQSIRISKIFEWYKDDFGGVIDFLNRYALTKIKPDARVQYLEYDWGLNEQ